ncbi:hypothetical protein ACEE16_10675 [Streptococcus suis]
MSDTITINNLNGLSDYATSVTIFTDNYEAAIAQSVRTFRSDLSGEQAEAINAFMAKLNDLQDTVFTQYPQALREYSQVVSAYYDQVSGLGFSSLVHSLQDDADAVARTLEGEQLDAITTITGKLKTAFQEAADAMGTSPESVASIDSLAETSLLEAGRRRKDVGRQLQEAYEEFTKGLVEKTAHLQALATAISNVSYVTSIPSSVIFRAIKNGILTADEMHHFDILKSETDAEALKHHYMGRYDEFFELEATKISGDIYSIIITDMNDIINGDNLELKDQFEKQLEEGLNVLIAQKYDNRIAHLGMLEIASENYSRYNFGLAVTLYQEGIGVGNETFDHLMSNVTSNQQLYGLWRSLSILGLSGQNRVVSDRPVDGQYNLLQKNTISNLTFGDDGFSYDINWKRYGVVSGQFVESSNDRNNARVTANMIKDKELLESKDAKDVTEWKEERAKVIGDTILNATSTLAGSASPYAKYTIEALRALSNIEKFSDYKEIFDNTAVVTADLFSDIHRTKGGQTAFSLFSDVLKGVSSYQDLSEKIQNQNDINFAVVLGQDALHSSFNAYEESQLHTDGEVKDKEILQINPYNIESFERIQKFEDGIKSHMTYQGEKDFETAWRKVESLVKGEEEQKVLEYFARGKSSGISFTQLDYDSYSNVVDDLKDEGIILPW